MLEPTFTIQLYGPTVTLSKVEVFSAALLCTVTAKPAWAAVATVTVIDPTCVQATPSAEVNPVNVLNVKDLF
ncbi:MAG TPA: hypothetical protein VK738_18450 [Terriglobales bacterium]|jgi:hypothetical protein|nr:hypothetical protein [Terriglobales bacterium]